MLNTIEGTVQDRNKCIMIKIVIGIEKKMKIKNLRSLYSFTNDMIA